MTNKEEEKKKYTKIGKGILILLRVELLFYLAVLIVLCYIIIRLA